MKEQKILFIVGSFREASMNWQMAERIAELLKGRAAVDFLVYHDLPYFNQDLEEPAPSAVARVRRQIKEADGIWIVTPEYNRSYPGLLKNLLDWLSRPVTPSAGVWDHVLLGKKIALGGVGGAMATKGARTKLFEVLEFIQAKPMTEPSVGVSQTAEVLQSSRLFLTEADEAALLWQVEAFLEFLRKDAEV